MTGMLLALLAVLCTGFGARDQLVLAGVVARHGPRPALLLIGMISAVTATGIVVAASDLLAGIAGRDAHLILAAVAAGAAGLELLNARRIRLPEEPTHSLGAFALVLLALQLTDPVRLLVFAIAVATWTPLTSWLGGSVGSAALMLGAWLGGARLLTQRAVPVRRALGGIVLVAAAIMALRGLDCI